MLDTLIRDVMLLREGVWMPCDLAIEAAQIVAISAGLSEPAKEELAGEGAYVFPGGVDLHVHFNEPGRTHWEGFETGSAAAAAAGVTYLAEMPLNSIPSTVNLAALQQKLSVVAAKSYVDFGLWGGVVPGNTADLLPLAEAGVMGFKAFMSPSGTDDFCNSDTATLKAAMQQIAPTGLRLALHAEDPAVLDRAAQNQVNTVSAYDWEASRPVESEISAVKIALELAGETGCPITIVHVSSVEVLEVILEAKALGVDVTAETCPHYLLLSIEDADRIGADAKCAPPLRPVSTMRALQVAVLAGKFDTIGSDHSPSSPELKAGKAFYDAWGGIAGLQHGYSLLLDRFELSNAAHMQPIQAACSARPAQLAGLSSKGSLQVGMDADFCLIRQTPEAYQIQASSLLTRHLRSAYVNAHTSVEIMSTWLRGQCIFSKGQVSAAPVGRFIPRAKL
jgi:allantoinase